MAKACGKSDCKVSTGICESLTFGSGRLSIHGYWEFPCEVCARAFELKYPEYYPCWPAPNYIEKHSNAPIPHNFDEFYDDVSDL